MLKKRLRIVRNVLRTTGTVTAYCTAAVRSASCGVYIQYIYVRSGGPGETNAKVSSTMATGTETRSSLG